MRPISYSKSSIHTVKTVAAWLFIRFRPLVNGNEDAVYEVLLVSSTVDYGPSCVTGKKTAKRKWPHEILVARHAPRAFQPQEFPWLFFRIASRWPIAKRARPKNRMQMIISPTKLIQHQRDLRELEGIKVFVSKMCFRNTGCFKKCFRKIVRRSGFVWVMTSLRALLFTFLTQLIKPNYLVILPTDAAPQFLWKLAPFMHSKLPCNCLVKDHRWCQNVVRTSVTHSAIASGTVFLFLPHFAVIYFLLLNRRKATWNLFGNNKQQASFIFPWTNKNIFYKIVY